MTLIGIFPAIGGIIQIVDVLFANNKFPLNIEPRIT